MSKQVLSARGEMVDFDLMTIKQQISTAPTTTNVSIRENFVEQKMRRRVKNALKQASQTGTEHDKSTE